MRECNDVIWQEKCNFHEIFKYAKKKKTSNKTLNMYKTKFNYLMKNFKTEKFKFLQSFILKENKF